MGRACGHWPLDDRVTLVVARRGLRAYACQRSETTTPTSVEGLSVWGGEELRLPVTSAARGSALGRWALRVAEGATRKHPPSCLASRSKQAFEVDDPECRELAEHLLRYVRTIPT
jgi:hypothetical protein